MEKWCSSYTIFWSEKSCIFIVPVSHLHICSPWRDFLKHSWQSVLECEMLSCEMAHVKEWCCFMAWALLHFWKTGYENGYLWLLPEWSFLLLPLWSKCNIDFGPWDVLWKVKYKKTHRKVGSGEDEGDKGKWKSSKSLVLVLRSQSWWLVPITSCQKPSHVFWHIVSYGKGTQRMCLKKDFPTASAYGVLLRDMVVYHLYSYKSCKTDLTKQTAVCVVA